MILANILENPKYEGDRKVWQSHKSKVVTIPPDFANEGERLHVWKIDDHTIILTKLPVFEFVRKIMR